MDGIASMTEKVLAFSGAMAGAAAAVLAGVAKMADSGESMHYMAARIGDTVANIDGLTYAMSRLGVSPQAAIQNMTALSDAMRNNPALAGLWNQEAGPGTRTEQLENFFKKMHELSENEQRWWRQQFGFSMDFWLAGIRGAGGETSSGRQEFNMVQRMFRFDPDRFGEQARAFEDAWRSLQLRLNTLWGHTSQQYIDYWTRAMEAVTGFLDRHSDQILMVLNRIGAEFAKIYGGAFKLIGDVVGWFERLTASQQGVAEAIAVIGVAFLSPGWLKIGAIAIVLEKLLADYEAFKKTGESPLGIPWAKIGEDIDYLVKKLDALNTATGGWLSVMHVLEAYVGGKLLLTFVRFFSSIELGSVAAGTALRTGIGSALGFVAEKLLAIAAIGGGAWSFLAAMLYAPAETESWKQEQELLRENRKKQGLPEHPGTPTDLPLGRVPGTAPSPPPPSPPPLPRIPSIGPIFGPQLDPISSAKAEELPDNIKKLSERVFTLNDTLQDMLDNMLVQALGGHERSDLDAYGMGGGSGKKFNINDPQATEDVKYLMSKGVGMMDAIALVSTAFSESSLDPQAVNKTSGATGLFQDLGPRKTQLLRFLQERHTDLRDRNAQYDFALQELQTTEKTAGDALIRSHSIGEKVRGLATGFERGQPWITVPSAMNAATALMNRDPSSYADYGKETNINQTNNVNIDSRGSADEVARAWRAEHERSWGNLLRTTKGALQ